MTANSSVGMYHTSVVDGDDSMIIIFTLVETGLCEVVATIVTGQPEPTFVHLIFLQMDISH